MIREDVKKILMVVESLYPNFKIKDPQSTLSAWSMVLDDQDKDVIAAALKHYAKTDNSGFAPSPGQLVQIAQTFIGAQGAEFTEAEAWAKVYRAICRSGDNAKEEFDKLPTTMQKAVGSASQLHEWAMDSNFNESVVSSNFRRAYRAACEREKNEALLPQAIKSRLQSMTQSMIEG